MAIVLTREQQRWIDEAVAAGRFASVEEALQYALGTVMLLEESLADDDLAWAKPLVEAGRAALAEHGGVPAAKVFEETGATIAQRTS
jgi:Arc/MetJ-type ribon-helix-helix transcriptional regulator